MSFPIDPPPGADPRMFEVVDPFGLRHPIIPLLELDQSTGLVTGLGTAFRVDPQGQFLTAQHTLEHRLRITSPRSTVVGLLNPGLSYGLTPLQPDNFAMLMNAHTFRSEIDDPLAALRGESPTRNTFDCMKFALNPENGRVHADRRFLPMRLRGRHVRSGDQVMAIGFPEIRSLKDTLPNEASVLSERMVASVGTITEVHPTGRLGRPWSTIEVDAHWPSGMSGGPVFSEHGEVIGLVSSSDEPEGAVVRSYAFWFAPMTNFDRWLPSLDPDNPGWIRGWAVVRSSPWSVIALLHERVRAEQIRETHGDGYEVRYGSLRYGSDEFTELTPS